MRDSRSLCLECSFPPSGGVAWMSPSPQGLHSPPQPHLKLQCPLPHLHPDVAPQYEPPYNALNTLLIYCLYLFIVLFASPPSQGQDVCLVLSMYSGLAWHTAIVSEFDLNEWMAISAQASRAADHSFVTCSGLALGECTLHQVSNRRMCSEPQVLNATTTTTFRENNLKGIACMLRLQCE